jgi:DNA-binding winged helix-turn-helix (wHTH) protein
MPAPSLVIQFGPFELNRSTGELRKQGTRIRLQPKPMQILSALLEKPGELVTRDELKSRLWPDDTFVDFESGLNTAVNRVRIALGDSAEHPRYIATEARSGYRLIAPAQTPAPIRAEPAPEAPQSDRLWPKRSLVAAFALSVIALAAGVRFQLPGPQVAFRQITFRRGQVSGARFAEGSRTIIYAAQWENEPRRLYQTHVGDPVSRVLGFEGLSLTAVSRTGELAVLRSGRTMNIRGGTLSRVIAEGGRNKTAARIENRIAGGVLHNSVGLHDDDGAVRKPMDRVRCDAGGDRVRPYHADLAVLEIVKCVNFDEGLLVISRESDPVNGWSGQRRKGLRPCPEKERS